MYLSKMKLAAYILLFQFSLGALIPNCDFYQIAKVPFLIEHYQLHKNDAESSGIDYDVFDFVYTHFITCEVHQHPKGFDHDQLPLKSISSSIQFSINLPILICSESAMEINSRIFQLAEFSGVSILNSIFHPPSI